MDRNLKHILLWIAMILLLSGCATMPASRQDGLTASWTCREKAVLDAEQYAAMGREVRIAAYCVGVVGRIVGMGLWSSHVQAQVWDGTEWLWVGEFGGLHKTPTYSTRPMVISDTKTYPYIWWSLEDYKKMLLNRDEILKQSKSPCDWF